MRAAVCRRLDGAKSIVVEELNEPELQAFSVRVEIHYASLNFMDLLIISGKYQYKPPLPFIPGHDGAGVILEVGEDVREHKIGDRVAVGTTLGTFAEQIVVHADEIMPLPDHVPLNTGSAYRASYCSALYALEHRAKVQKGEHLVITGAAGGVGLAAVQLGRIMGAEITGVVGSKDKRQIVIDHGANTVVIAENGRLRDELRSVVGQSGADVFLDTVGGNIFIDLLYCAAWDARLLILGFASGLVQKIPANLPLLKSASVLGVNYGAWQKREQESNRDLHKKIFSWIESGELSIHIDSQYPLAKINEALIKLESRRSRGKVLIAMNT